MAIYIPQDGQINANHYTKALFTSLKQRQIKRYVNTEVQSVQRQMGTTMLKRHKAHYKLRKSLWQQAHGHLNY